jgi:hypothetical protein
MPPPLLPALRRAARRLALIEDLTRPEPRALARPLRRRWRELPPHARHAAQSIGQRTVGCEGTHGVFPRCNLACTPCYHSRDANRVRVDGEHTVREIDRQMAYLASQRGPGQNAQLIGGEVTLLGPEAHAAALQAMHRHGRKPMSMTHGDFDEDYLRRLALGPDGRPRFRELIFAAHFDSLMLGRRGVPRPRSEGELDAHRARFTAMFQRLRAETGVRHYLAHNMTVTPSNAGQIPEVVRSASRMGFRMLSFQPAAFQGNRTRWKESYRDLSADDIWGLIEAGAGTRLPFRTIQTGDERCNRTAYGVYVGARWVALLDDRDPRDLAWRDSFYASIGGMDVQARPALALSRLARGIARDPRFVPRTARLVARVVRRAGGVGELRRHRPRPVTFVMHRFMDQADVVPAWELLERGRMSDDPRIRETQERLQACSYHMAHPDTGRLIPACAQHAVFDPEENRRLARLLPLPQRAPAA